MKKYFLISALTLFVLTGCKKEATNDMDSDNSNDSTATKNSEMVDETATDTTMSDATDEDPLNKMSVEKTTTTTDPADGKFTLSENKWLLTEIYGKAVNNKSGKDYFINLDSKSGSFVAFAGCNNVKGNYVMTKPGNLSLTKMISTKMACSDMKTENEFMAALSKTDNYMVEGDMLHFHKGKTAIAKFTIKK